MLGTKAPNEPATQVAVDQIRPNPYQPREHFDEEALAELRESIRVHGVLQPILVRRTDDGLELIAGERRWRASKEAGLTRIPAIVRDEVSDAAMIEIALVENLQREDLDPIERALGYRRMIEQLGLSQSGVAKRVGLKRSTIANHLRLLELPSQIQRLVVDGSLSMGHARALLGMPDEAVQLQLADRIVQDGMSVRDAEEAVREGVRAIHEGESGDSASTPPVGDAPKVDRDQPIEPWARALADRLQKSLGTKVEIRNREGYQGQIVLEYYDRKGLDSLVDQLAPPDTI